MHQIRAISLDLDDTLWEVGPVIRRAETELWRWLALHYPRVTARFSPETAFELRRQIAEAHVDMAHDFRFLRKRVLAQMADEAGYGEHMVDAAYEVFDVARNCVELFPDVEPALGSLFERYTVIAVTNGNASLQRIGIDHLFHDAVSAADAGVAKPHPGIFAAAVDKAGVEPGEVLHVGDHPELDVVGAARAGLRTAWINRTDADWPAQLPAPDAVVTTMTELGQLLDTATPPVHC
ncbi:MAG: HAD family hydrolase [Pseudomonadota bacterium]